MPRDSNGRFTRPITYLAGTKARASDVNQNEDDIVSDLNTPRPIVVGGTGSATAADARAALGITKANIGLGNVANKSEEELVSGGAVSGALATKANLNAPSFTGPPRAQAYFAEKDGYPSYEYVDTLASGLKRRWASYIDSPTGALVFLDRGPIGDTGPGEPWAAFYPNGRVRLKQLSQAGNLEGDLRLFIEQAIAVAVATPKAYGAIGSYILAATVSPDVPTAYAPGATVPGSVLRPAGLRFGNIAGPGSDNLREASGHRDITNAGLSGSWRLMGYQLQSQGTIDLYQRIA